MAIENLYDEVMMDHIKNARNYREIPDAHRKVSAINRLCGDEITVYLSVKNDQIDDISFRCSSCGISMASASIMTEVLKGKTCADARKLSQAVRAQIEQSAPSAASPISSELSVVLTGLQAFPARKTCAALAWHALTAALDNREESISVG